MRGPSVPHPISYSLINGGGPLSVPLLSHLFNGIAVGRSDGNHEAGGTLTGYDRADRMKPEMVAPASATSYATPLVSGASALLIETARNVAVFTFSASGRTDSTLADSGLCERARHYLERATELAPD